MISQRIRTRLNASGYLRDVLMQASGNTAAQVLGIAAMPLLTRLYAPDDFAALNLFTQVVAGLAILLTLRFEYLLMLPAEQDEAASVLRLIFRLGAAQVVWLTPVLALLPAYWPWIRAQGGIADWLWLAPISAWCLSLSVGVQQLVQREGNFRNSAASEFAGRFAYVVVSMLGVLALPNIFGLMVSTLANAVAKLAWLKRACSGLLRMMLKNNGAPIAPSIRRMAASTSASNLIALSSSMAPMVFIADNYGSSALGQYGLVVSTLFLPSTLLGQAIGQVYYQRACQLQSSGLPFTGLLVSMTTHLIKVGVPLYSLIALIAPMAYPLVFGADWASSGNMARWLCIAAVAGFISTPLDKTSIIAGAWWYLSVWHSLRAALTAGVLALVSVYHLPLETCIALLALQTAFAYGIDWVASYIFTKQPTIKQF